MLVVSNVLNSEADKDAFLSIKALVFGDSDVRYANQVAPFGIDSRPPDTVDAIYSDTAANDQVVIVGYLNQDTKAGKGEVRMYSVNASIQQQAYAWIKADGTVEINGAADNAVRFAELKKSFDQLKQDFNSLVNAFNTHVHPTAASGPPSTPTPVPNIIPATPSTATIDAAKVDTVKLP